MWVGQLASEKFLLKPGNFLQYEGIIIFVEVGPIELSIDLASPYKKIFNRLQNSEINI